MIDAIKRQFEGRWRRKKNSVIYMGLVPRPNKADNICAKTKVTGMMQRDSTVYDLKHKYVCIEMFRNLRDVTKIFRGFFLSWRSVKLYVNSFLLGWLEIQLPSMLCIFPPVLGWKQTPIMHRDCGHWCHLISKHWMLINIKNYVGCPESKDTNVIAFFKNSYYQNWVKKLFNTYL